MGKRTQLNHGDFTSIVLSTLASKSAKQTNTNIDGTREQGIKLRRIKANMTYTGKTAGEGPISVGLTAGLTAAEVAEAIVADPQRFEDPGSSEKANRRVFPVWFIGDGSTQTDTNPEQNTQLLVDIHAPTWEIPEEQALNWYAFNHDSGALTNGIGIDIINVIVYDWLED